MRARSLGRKRLACAADEARSSAAPGQAGIDVDGLRDQTVEPRDARRRGRAHGGARAAQRQRRGRPACRARPGRRRRRGCRRPPGRPRPAARPASRQGAGSAPGGRGARHAWRPRTARRSWPDGSSRDRPAGSHSQAWPATMPYGAPTARPTISDQGASRGGGRAVAARQGLEGQHDQRIARQHRQRLAEGAVHRRLAAPGRRVVEAGQVVMDQRGAMQQLDRRGGGVGDAPASSSPQARGHRQAELGPDAGAAGKHRVAQRGGQPGRAARGLGPREAAVRACSIRLTASMGGLPSASCLTVQIDCHI